MFREKCNSWLSQGAVCLFLAATSCGAKEWVNLFDGMTLKGWTQKNGTAKYKVDQGTIVGTTNEGSPNSFLCSDQEYGDFELEFDVKVHDNLNSGVQIRSKTKPDGGRVYGPQVEIEASGTAGALAGFVYGEATERGWLSPESRRIPHKKLKNGEWNHFRVVAQGPRIQTWINGEMVEDLTDEPIFKTHAKGFIGLQVHGIGAGQGPYQVAWKNIRLKQL